METLALLVQCEKKLGVLLEVLGKSATGVAKAPEPAFITEPVRATFVCFLVVRRYHVVFVGCMSCRARERFCCVFGR